VVSDAQLGRQINMRCAARPAAARHPILRGVDALPQNQGLFMAQ
jgi:hypothetical protein